RTLARERVDELAVRRGDGVEIPRLRDQLLRFPERAELGAEREHLGHRAVAREVAQLVLALDVRRDPQAAPERAEPGPRQPGANLVAHLAPLLRHPERHEQPLAVPRPWLPEPVDALGAGPEHVGGLVGEIDAGASPMPLRAQPAAGDAAGQRLARRVRLVAE